MVNQSIYRPRISENQRSKKTATAQREGSENLVGFIQNKKN